MYQTDRLVKMKVSSILRQAFALPCEILLLPVIDIPLIQTARS